MTLCRRSWLFITLLGTPLVSNVCWANENVHRLFLSNYSALFATEFETDKRQVISPLGGQVDYSFRNDMRYSYFGQYTVLSSGTAILLHGLSAGIDAAIWGGQRQSWKFPANTLFTYSFPFRVGLQCGASIKSYNLSSLNTSAKKNPLVQTVPEQGMLVSLAPGLSAEGRVWGRLSYTSRAVVEFPYFLSKSQQKGSIISLSLGLGTRF